MDRVVRCVMAAAMLLTSPPDEMSGLALYVLPFGMGDEEAVAAWLPVDFGWMLVSWLAARLAFRALQQALDYPAEIGRMASGRQREPN